MKTRKIVWQKVISAFLIGTMILGSFTPLQVRAASNEPVYADSTSLDATKELDLTFDDTIADTSGKNNLVASYGKDNIAKAVTYTEGISGKALSLDGSTYLDLGTSATLQPSEMTLSFWVKAQATMAGEHIIMWNKPSGAWDGDGWYLTSLNDTVPLRLSVGSSPLTEISLNADRAKFFPVGEWVNVVVTFSSATGETAFYRNGVYYEPSPKTCSSKIISDTTVHKYLGFNSPGYNGGYSTLIFDEYEIYSSIATQTNVTSMYQKYVTPLSDQEIVDKDKEALNPFEGADVNAITRSITLPTEGDNGSEIVWASDNENVISTSGSVSRPTDADVTVTLAATITSGLVTDTKTFVVTVLKKTIVEGNEFSAYLNDQFELDEVKVTDGYYKGAQDSDVAFLKKFDNDRIVAGFRENAGLDKKGAARYNGWENGLLAGHSVGHYLTASAQAVLATDDVALETKLDAIVHELKLCQDKSGTYGGSKAGFLFGANVSSTSNVELQFDIVQGDSSGSTWVPWYNMHKVVQGLVDVYKYTGNEEALDVATKLGDWVYNRVGKWTTTQQSRVLGTEYGGMNDCMYELYKITHDTNHRDAAHKFDDPNLYGTILSGVADRLNGRHANTTIPKFVGAINRYVTLKEVENVEATEYLAYAEGFWSLVVEKHVFITGGTSDMEHFKADNALDEIRSQCNCESCCAHNMLKLSKELYKVTGKIKYADYYESTLRNSIMSAVNEAGAFAYFIPMASGYYKTFGTTDPATNMFWCCTGSGMENYTKLGDSIYFKTADALTVNQYLASEVTWSEKDIKLTQNSDVTTSETAEFTINLLNGKTDVNAKLNLRIPDWTTDAIEVKVNNTTAAYTVEGGYIILNRTWKNNDKVTLTYPMEVVAYGLPDNDTVYGFKYGPTVLAAKLGTAEWNKTTWAGANLTAPEYKVVGSEKVSLQVSYGKTTKKVLGTETISIQENVTTKDFIKNINSKLVKTEGKLEFHIKGTDSETVFGGEGLTFVPFNTLNSERYGIYWYFESLEDSSEEKILADKEEGRFASAVIDSIQPGYQQYENDAIHQMKESNTVFETGVVGLGSTRSANPSGSFTYNMKVDKANTNSLLCQFAKADVGKTIKITIGSTVFNYTVESYAGEDVLFKKYFEIPATEIANAQVLTVAGVSYNIVKVKFESGSAVASARIVNGLYMVRAYSNDASLIKLTPSEGRIKVSESIYTVSVPLATERASITFDLANKSGLLYIDGKLVNDAKAQTVVMAEGTTTIPLKVYAEDHKTFKDYTLVLVRADGLDVGEEILVNGAIENGTANWTANDSAVLGLGYATKYAGNNSLKVSERTKTTAGATQDITGKVKAGETYELDGYVIFKQGSGHNENPPANATFNVSILYGEGAQRDVMVSQSVKLDAWGNLYGDYTIPKDADLSKVSILFETDYKESPTADDLIVFFIDNVSMKLILSDDGNDDKIAAEAVDTLINEIGTIEYTTVCKTKIDTARAAYNALTSTQQALVTNLAILTSAETAYQALELANQADRTAADAVQTKINDIGTVEYTIVCKAKIDTARSTYNALTAVQKALVTNLETLTKAESAYKALELASEADKAKVKVVQDLISGVGTVSYNSDIKSKIDSARAAYDKLTQAQKILVSNYTILTAAETKYNQLKDQAELQNDSKDVVKQGATYKIGSYNYKVTSIDKKIVSVVGVTNKNLSTIKVNKTVKIKGSVFTITEIGTSAFKNCTKATKATISLGVKVIGNTAFYNCKKLKSITINSTVLTKIGSKAFYSCSNLKSIIIKSTKLKSVGLKTFNRINKNAKIKVPAKKIKAYTKLMKNKGQKKSVKVVK